MNGWAWASQGDANVVTQGVKGHRRMWNNLGQAGASWRYSYMLIEVTPFAEVKPKRSLY